MNIVNILKNNKNRVTPERIAIFNYLKTKHIFTYNDIKENFKNIWRASIFRTLNLFLELWVIRKVEFWKKIMAYEIDDKDNHHEHMMCEKCDSIISFDSNFICNKIFDEATKIWFKVKQHSIWVLGICKKCL